MGPTSPTTARRRLPDAVKLVLALLAAVLMLEIGWRVVLRVRGAPYDHGRASERLVELTTGLRQATPSLGDGGFAGPERPELRALSPYYGWESPHSQQAFVEQQAFFRGPERAKVYTVLLLGGSVGQQMGVAGATPGFFKSIVGSLPAVQGREVLLLVWARGSFKQPQQLMLLQQLLAAGTVPDALLEIDGFNEVALGNDNAAMGIHPIQPHWPMWGRLASQHALSDEALEELGTLHALRNEAGELSVDSLALHSAVLGTLRLREAEALHTRFGQSQSRLVATLAAHRDEDPARGPRYEATTDEALEECATLWANSSRSMAALCRAHNIPYLHVLQPTLHDEGAKPVTAEERERGQAAATWIEGARLGYPKLRQRGAELAQEGLPFVDLSRIFAEWQETAYVDVCHFKGAPMRHFAERVARELAARVEAK